MPPLRPGIAASRLLFLYGFLFLARAVQPQTPQNSPDRWSEMPLRPAELQRLIAKSQLVARVRILQHWPARLDLGSHTQFPEHMSLMPDKIFKGRGQKGVVDLVCVCSEEHASEQLAAGREVLVFASFNRGDKAWEPAGEQYYLPYSAWLDREISERLRPH